MNLQVRSAGGGRSQGPLGVLGRAWHSQPVLSAQAQPGSRATRRQGSRGSPRPQETAAHRDGGWLAQTRPPPSTIHAPRHPVPVFRSPCLQGHEQKLHNAATSGPVFVPPSRARGPGGPGGRLCEARNPRHEHESVLWDGVGFPEQAPGAGSAPWQASWPATPPTLLRTMPSRGHGHGNETHHKIITVLTVRAPLEKGLVLLSGPRGGCRRPPPHRPAAEGASDTLWSFCGPCSRPRRVRQRSPRGCPRLAAKRDRGEARVLGVHRNIQGFGCPAWAIRTRCGVWCVCRDSWGLSRAAPSRSLLVVRAPRSARGRGSLGAGSRSSGRGPRTRTPSGL